MALKTLRCCGDSQSTEQRSALRDIYHLNPPPNYIPLLRGLSPINLMHWHEAQCLMRGIMGPFPSATAIVRRLLCVFCSVPEHEKLLSSGTTPYWASLESSCLKQDDSCVVLVLATTNHENTRLIQSLANLA